MRKSILFLLVASLSVFAFTASTSAVNDAPAVKSYPLDVKVAPGFNRDVVTAQLIGIEKARKYWKSTVYIRDTIPVFFGTERNVDWFVKHSIAIRQPWIGQHVAREVEKAGANINTAGTHTGGGTTVITFTRGSKQGKLSSGELSMGAHEYTHVVQHKIIKDLRALPCWALEGGATYFSNKIVGYNYKAPTSYIRPASALLPDMEENNSPECTGSAGYGYTLGYTVNKYLADTYGDKSIIRWWKQTPAKGWRQAFIDVYGMSVEDLYRKF